MRTIAIIDEFEQIDEQKKEQIDQLRKMTQADFIVAVMSGNYLQRGVPAEASKHLRAKAAVEAGVDAVFERPVYTALTSLDTYVPSGIALLEKLNGIDEICVPIDLEYQSLMDEITLFLFAEGKEYQNQMRGLRQKGYSYYDAQAALVGRHFSDSQSLESHMKRPVNYIAFEYLKSLKRMYSSMKPRLLSADYFSQVPDSDRGDAAGCEHLFPLMKYEILLIRDKMTQIYGGSTLLANRMLDVVEKSRDYAALVRDVATKEHPAADIRRFLLNILLGIGKSDIAMSRMYDSAPYARLLAGSDQSGELIASLKQKSRIPVITDLVNEYKTLDATCRALLDIDIRASKIYKSFV